MNQSHKTTPRPTAARPRPAPAGFTLIETVLALAILGMSVFALMQATAQCLAVIRVARNYNTARAVLEQGALDHPMVWTNSPSDNEVASAEYPNGYYFSRTVSQSDLERELYVVATRVTWTDRGETGFEEVLTFGYFPEQDSGL